MSLSHPALEHRLAVALEAASLAAALLREEFNRPGGPRGEGSHADVDEEVEVLVREHLARHFPGEAWLGEELQAGVLGGGERQDPAGPVWVVDPNDGTSPYLKGCRGSAVSIALVEDGQPVLGVVQAWDGARPEGEVFAWHKGGRFTRNGEAVTRQWPEEVRAHQVALISHQADIKNTLANARAVAPMRYITLPSIAWRMALVAAGEGDVTVSLGGPESWDLAAGHALLLGAGGLLLNRRGGELHYNSQGHCQAHGGIFAGAPALARELARRDWEDTLVRDNACPGAALARALPRAPRPRRDVLERAQGCLLGQLAGDALGAQVEFMGAAEIARRHPGGLRELCDGGTWNTLAGQPTDDSEMALALARCLVEVGAFDAGAVRQAYVRWLESGPFDVGGTVNCGLRGRPNSESQANGSLMRLAPLGIFGALARAEDLARWAAADAAITHPHPLCVQAAVLMTRAQATAIRQGADPAALHRQMLEWSREAGAHQWTAVLEEARLAPPADYTSQAGWVRVALHNAVWQLLHAPSLEEALVDTVGRGGDTDTNAAIAGALLGAVHGAAALPARWRLVLMSCRPLAETGAYRPRPAPYWPVDALVLAERLLMAGADAQA